MSVLYFWIHKPWEAPMLLGTLFSGEEVFRDEYSKIHLDVLSHLQTAFDRMDTRRLKRSRQRQRFACTTRHPRVVGTLTLVQTAKRDEIVYAIRADTGRFTKLVKNKPAIETNRLAVKVQRRAGRYVVRSARPGFKKFIPEPSRPELLAEQKISLQKSLNWWRNRAFVWDRIPIVPGTETKTCPW